MKKNLAMLALSISFLPLSAQNLVPNWSFEDTIACPSAGSEIYNSSGWSSYNHSPDYFNSCSSGIVGIPFNFAGFHYPKTGNAYAGIICYYSPVANSREFLGAQLTQSLLIGQLYYVSFYVATAFSYAVRFGIGINKIGMRVSTVAYSSTNPVPIDNYSQVFNDSVITDTMNWTKVSGSFIADSSYNYISFGNFFSDSLTSITLLDSNAWYAYYYIDDIRLSTDSNFVNLIGEHNIQDLINIFPNPSSGSLDIRGVGIEYIIISDAFGKLVFNTKTAPAFYNQIDVSFSKGVYFLTAVSKKSNVIKKIIIQ